MTADPALDAGPLTHQVVAMVDQEPHLTLRAGKTGSGEVGLRQAAVATGSASIGSDFPASRAVPLAPDISWSAREASNRRSGGREDMPHWRDSTKLL